MDRRYIKELAVKKGQPLGSVADMLGINQVWMSQVIAGAAVSKTLAKMIETWSGGSITADRVMADTNKKEG